MSAPFVLERGARVLAGGGVVFSVWAPRARRVSVAVDGGTERPLAPAGGGVFAAVVEEARAGSDYAFRLDGGAPLPDPVSRFQPAGVHGPSRVVQPEAFVWSDAGFAGVERADLVFYELHVGTFSEKGTFDAAIEHLEPLRDLGVTALEIMPVAQFPGARNWGYDGVFPYAPQNTYGGPDGLRSLVDAAHGVGLAVVLDVVYNHLGPEGAVLGRYGPYFTSRHQTPWGDGLDFDGSASEEVRRYFVDNALHWIAEYHLDGLRLDAVHAICDASARPFLAELGRAVHDLGDRLGRRVHVLPESDANDPRLVRPLERGGLGLDAVWSDDFHHAVHAALTGERDGYYIDFGGTDAIAKCLRDRFVYDGVPSRYRGRRHGAPARDLPPDRFVVCIQNHDQVGNRPRGERLASLLPPERLRLAACLLLLSPYLPLLFMGEEYGETRPFLYFVDHGDPALLAAVREGRRREFAAIADADAVPDPGAPETFEASRLRPERALEPGGAALRRLYAELLALRREEPALRPGAAAVEVATPAPGTLDLVLRPAGAARRPATFARFQIGETRAPGPAPGAAGPWSLRFDSADGRFGGPGSAAPARLEPGSRFGLDADTACLWREEG